MTKTKDGGVDRDQCLLPFRILNKRSFDQAWHVRSDVLEKIHVAWWVAALAICYLIFIASAYAQMDARQQRGLTLARANCARCHSIDKVTASPLRLAPPFRELHNRYPVESLEEALGEGIVTGHPNMPEFRLDPGQVGDLISYLKWLER